VGKQVDAILRVRMGSSRLPGKALLPVLSRPLLSYVIERILMCRNVDRLVVATSTAEEDDAIAALCKVENIPLFRGSQDDVLDRMYQCAKYYDMKIIAHFQADCPLVDPDVTDQVIAFFWMHENDYDFVSNNHPPTWPEGLEVDIFTIEALQKAWQLASEPFEREHVTPFIWDQPDRFRVGNVALEDDSLYQANRWTVDFAEDFELVKQIFVQLYPQKPIFKMNDILALLEKKSELRHLNEERASSTWYTDYIEKLKTVDSQSLKR